jgi:hypothetical protein
MAGELTYFTIPHYPGEKVAGFPELADCMDVTLRLRLKEGERVGPDLFDRVDLRLRKDAGRQLTDFLWSVDGLLVVSQRVREFLEAQDFRPDELELVPLTLEDATGKPLPKPYCVANPLLRFPCLDVQRSGARLFTNPVSGAQAWRVREVVIREDVVPKDARLFRLAEAPSHIILVRSDLLDGLRKAKFTGLVSHGQGEPIW